MNTKSFRALVLVLLCVTVAFADDPPAGKKEESKKETIEIISSKPLVLPKGASSLFPAPAQGASTQAKKSAAQGDEGRLGTALPKADWFLGYTYMRLAERLGAPAVNVNGASTNVGFNVNKYFGVVADFGGGAYTRDLGVTDQDGKAFTYLFGPRISWRNWPRAVPFVQTLVGGLHASEGGAGESSFAWTAGGGVDVVATPRIAVRLFQAEYMATWLRDATGSRDLQNNFRLASGLVFRLGVPTPPPPPNHSPTASCSASKSSVYAGSGDAVAVTATASDPDGDSLTYTWSANGGSVEGSGPTARWNSANVAAGNYRITANISDGKGGTASCYSDVSVAPKPNASPTMSCSAERSSVLTGERVRINARAQDADNDPLNYTWRTSAGQIVGSGSSVQLDTTGLSAGRYTVTGRVDDGRGGAADCATSVEVTVPPPPPQASKLNECFFRNASARVDNVCKRILDDVVVRLNNEPTASVTLVGFAGPKEARAAKLSTQRAVEAAKYLTGKGVAASRISQKTGTGQEGADKQNRRLDVIWVPQGATF